MNCIQLHYELRLSPVSDFGHKWTTVLSIERQMLLSWLPPVLKRSNFTRSQSVNLVLECHLQDQEVIFWRAFWFELQSLEEEYVLICHLGSMQDVSVCSNTLRDNWTLTSDSDFLLIKKAGTFLHRCAEIHSSHAQTTINYCCLVEPSWKNATTLNPKSSLIVSRFPVCYVG